MLEQMGKQAKDAAFILAQLNTTEKNHALSIIADQLEHTLSILLTLFSGFALRLLAVRFGWGLPVFDFQEQEDETNDKLPKKTK